MQYYLSPIQPEPRFVLTNKEASSMDRNLHTARLLQCPLLICAERRLGLNHSLSPCIQNPTTRNQLSFTNTSHAHAVKNTTVEICCQNGLCSVRRTPSTPNQDLSWQTEVHQVWTENIQPLFLAFTFNPHNNEQCPQIACAEQQSQTKPEVITDSHPPKTKICLDKQRCIKC